MTLPASVVTYLRVSTDRQGQSSLGLDARWAAVIGAVLLEQNDE